MEYTKCENYPQCTFTECECHLKSLYLEHLKTPSIPTNKSFSGEKFSITGFEVVDGEIEPILKNKGYRVDIRNSKRGRIIESFWTDSFDPKTRPFSFVDLYQYFGKRLIKVCSFKPKN